MVFMVLGVRSTADACSGWAEIGVEVVPCMHAEKGREGMCGCVRVWCDAGEWGGVHWVPDLWRSSSTKEATTHRPGDRSRPHHQIAS